MTDSLRDQLLGLGFKPAPREERPKRDGAPRPSGDRGRPDDRTRQGKPRSPQGGDRARPAGPGRGPGRPQDARGPGAKGPRGPAKSREDIDLAKAYAIRAQREKDERIAAEKQKQEEARLRREARAKLDALLEGKALNDPAADIARHFEYGGKIKRVYVNADQLRALNAGELGLVQQNGRYLLVTRELLDVAEATFAPAVALRIDPDAPAGDDPYADPRYQVPDDLVW